MNVLAVIPARGGSKSIPGKNLVDVNGRPLLSQCNEYTNESFLQRQDLPPAYIYDGGIFARRRKILDEWSGRDFGLGKNVRAVVLGGWKSVHVDDPMDLEMVRTIFKNRTEA